MNTIIRQVLAFILSFALIFAATVRANAASSWNIDSAKSSGSRVVLGATNGGYKSAINIPPNLAKIAKFGMKGANAVGLIQIAAGFLNDGVDFVLDPANNRIKYTVLSSSAFVYGCVSQSCTKSTAVTSIPYVSSNSIADMCTKLGGFFNVPNSKPFDGVQCAGGASGNTSTGSYLVVTASAVPVEKHISIADIAPQVVKDAQSSNTQKRVAAQKILQDVAKAAVIAGDYDADLLAGAVPTTETKPLIPSLPGSQVGDVDTGMQGGDVGAAADAARDAADTAQKQAEAARDAATAAADEARRLNDEAKDLINSSIDEAIKDAATAAAAAAAKDFAEAQEVANAATAAAAKAAAEAVRAADAKTAEAVRAADAATAARDAAIAAGQSAEAIAAAEAKTAEAVAARDAAIAAAEVAKEKVKEAEKAAEAAKLEAKPFELPPFCSWATPVCDAVEWLMKPAPDLDDDTELDIDTPDISPVDTDINFGGSCPANFEFNGSMFGNSINIVLLDTSKFCGFLSTFVKFPVYAASSLFALYILGGRKDV